MKSIVLIILQALFFLVSYFLGPIGHLYLITNNYCTKISKKASIGINAMAFLGECILFRYEYACMAIFCISLILVSGVIFSLDLYCKKLYFEELRSRIKQLENDEISLLTIQEIRNKLHEKFQTLYSIEDIRKAKE